MREVFLLNNTHQPIPTWSAILVKNEATARRIAPLVDGTVVEEPTGNKLPFIIPTEAINQLIADKYRIKQVGDIYGAVVPHIMQAEKAILHPLVADDSTKPEWYHRKLASNLQSAVLPGYTVFTPDDAIRAFEKVHTENGKVRYKKPTSKNALGQFPIDTREELEHILADQREDLQRNGAVLEPDLQNPKTITVGTVILQGAQYSWVGDPKNVMHNGLSRFGSTELTVVKGTFNNLRPLFPNPDVQSALGQAQTVYDAYGIINSTLGRATFDIVQGNDTNGIFHSGVTDPSLRPVGSTPAEIFAIEAFKGKELNTVKTKVTYDYSHDNRPKGAEVYLSSPAVDIYVNLIKS